MSGVVRPAGDGEYVAIDVGPVPARSPDGIANALEDDVSKSPTRAQQDEELEGQPGEMRSGEPTELPGRGDHPSTATYNEADNWAYSAKPARGSVGDELSNKYVKGNHQTEWKQWKRGPLDKARAWAVSPKVLAALQYLGGQFIICLFVFVDALSYKQACLAGLFYTAISVLLSGDHTIGARVIASAALVGTSWIGLLMCGVAITIARTAGGAAYTPLMCVFSVLGTALCVLLRANHDHDIAGSGLFILVFFGIGMLEGQFIWPAGKLWRLVILELFADAAVAAACNILAGVLVLPALSSHALRDALATTLLKLAASVSGYAGVIVEHTGAGGISKAELEAARRSAFERSLPSSDWILADPWLDRKRMQRAVDPALQRAKATRRPPYVPRATALRPLLLQARTSALQAAFEPPFLMTSRLSGWRRVLEAVEALLTRVACLESAIEGATGEERLARLANLQRQTGVDVMHSLTAVFARIAASCATLASAVRDYTDLAKAKQGLKMFSESWGKLEAALAKGLHDSSVNAIRSMHWDPNYDAVAYRHMPEVRGLYYVCTLAGGIMEAVARLERAVTEALGRRARRRGRNWSGDTPADQVVAAALRPPTLAGSYRAQLSMENASWGTPYTPASRRTEGSITGWAGPGRSSAHSSLRRMSVDGSVAIPDFSPAAAAAAAVTEGCGDPAAHLLAGPLKDARQLLLGVTG
mmetsp:Transcript_18549/g.55979  ORF Transcript_18549/g.55979 Transcript_18549/m.55979 type:complete len:703 (-) Transcript_18549:245-2353(-)